jgi:hypothetical protein
MLRSTNYGAPHYAVFSRLLLFHPIYIMIYMIVFLRQNFVFASPEVEVTAYLIVMNQKC